MPDRDLSFEDCRPIEAHGRQVMDWRNDPVTLAMSYHREPKGWGTFWPEFRDEYFCYPDYPAPVFVASDGVRIAFLRFEPAAHPKGYSGRTVDISINVAPEHRGRGLGTAMLAAARDHLRGHGIDSVCAEVRTANESSAKSFLGAGFEEIEATDKTIPDTGEVARIRRFLAELSSPYWREGAVTVIAEAGSNWRMGTPARDSAMSRALIDVAVAAKADFVKFQTYRPETTYVANAGASDYLSEANITEDVGSLFADLAMPYEMVSELSAYCENAGIGFMSTPFSADDFAAIDPYVKVHKSASYEISHVRLLELAGRSGKPLVLSTGASTVADIAWAVDTFRGAGGQDLCLLQCTAKYPAPISSLNLRAIPWLARRFGVAAGLSDHSREPLVGPVAAVAVGARVIEKHFTLDNRLPGPDHAFALRPRELKAMVEGVREVEESLGTGFKEVQAVEAELASFARRGIQALRPIEAGERLSEGDAFAILRPGNQTLGAHPRHLDLIEGRTAKRAIPAGHGIQPRDCE